MNQKELIKMRADITADMMNRFLSEGKSLDDSLRMANKTTNKLSDIEVVKFYTDDLELSDSYEKWLKYYVR